MSTVQNKFLQVNKWGSPIKPGVLSMATETLDFSKIKADEVVVKTTLACIHPSDQVLAKNSCHNFYCR